MFSLKGARTSKIYRNCLESMLKSDVTLKCLMSNDSEHAKNILKIIKGKSNSKTDKRKLQMKTAERVFKMLRGNDCEKKFESVEQHTNLTEKINEIIKKAEAVPETSSDSVAVPVADKIPRRIIEDKYGKHDLLNKAKQVALALGVDVEVTQSELLEAFASVKGTPQPKAERREGHFVKNKKDIQFFRYEGGTSLNIFKKKAEGKGIQQSLQTWNRLKEITLLYWSLRPPKNYFEEQIIWTQQGKLWHFPLDNDQSWDEEIATDFADHVFLDKHLEPWCPKSGPIRHFMELVTTGLSKNPYLSAEKKKKHILWYRDYFQSKSSLLAELGVLDQNIDGEVKKLEAGGNIS